MRSWMTQVDDRIYSSDGGMRGKPGRHTQEAVRRRPSGRLRRRATSGPEPHVRALAAESDRRRPRALSDRRGVADDAGGHGPDAGSKSEEPRDPIICSGRGAPAKLVRNHRIRKARRIETRRLFQRPGALPGEKAPLRARSPLKIPNSAVLCHQGTRGASPEGPEGSAFGASRTTSQTRHDPSTAAQHIALYAAP